MTDKPFGNYCHKHGKGMFSRCQACIDELVAIGIQADKDRIAELERRLAVAVDALVVAKKNIADWGANAKASTQYVHDLKGDIERIDAALEWIRGTK